MHMVCVSCEYMECMFPRIACVSMECVIFTVCECVYVECMYVKYVGCVCLYGAYDVYMVTLCRYVCGVFCVWFAVYVFMCFQKEPWRTHKDCISRVLLLMEKDFWMQQMV